MKRVLMLALIVVVVVIIVTVALRQRSVSPPSPAPPPPGFVAHAQTTITLTPNGGDGCQSNDPDPLAQQNNGPVTWIIINNCGTAQVLEIKGFRVKATNQPDAGVINPLPATPNPTQPIPANGGQGQIRAVVTKMVPNGTHVLEKYQIWIGRTSPPTQLAKDPDFDIWP